MRCIPPPSPISPSWSARAMSSSRAFSGLERLSKILKLPFLGETRVLPRRSFPHGFAEDFQKMLKLHPEISGGDYALLDCQVPIQEGKGLVDFVAGSKKGELIFVWVFDKIGLDSLCRLVPAYDWLRKNRNLFQHLYSLNPAERILKLKVWVFSREIEGEAESLLPYLKEISLKLFKVAPDKPAESGHGAAVKTAASDDALGAKAFSRNALAFLKAASPTLPSITAEEAKDLTRPESLAEAAHPFEEDEITDPLIHLSDLKVKESSGG